MANGSADEDRILRKVVQDYNRSGNPGRFAVRPQGAGRYLVTGIKAKDNADQDREVIPIFDTPISVPVQERNGIDSVQAIIKQISAQTGSRMILGFAPINVLVRSDVSVGGTEQRPRDLLLQVLRGVKPAVAWKLLYNADLREYVLNLSVVTKIGFDSSGRPQPDTP
jgi:hypothetical protein